MNHARSSIQFSIVPVATRATSAAARPCNPSVKFAYKAGCSSQRVASSFLRFSLRFSSDCWDNLVV